MRRLIAWFVAGLFLAGTLGGCGLCGNTGGVDATPSGMGVQQPRPWQYDD